MVDKIIFKNQLFRPTKVESESHLEELIIANADTIFPHAYLFDYKRKAETKSLQEETFADLCLVSHDCSRWWIIEVELVGKGRAYILDTIQTQIINQADADWNKTAHHAIKELENRGVSTKVANNLKTIEPEFILLYDGEDSLMTQIANDHMFQKIIMKPMMSEMGNYLLLPLLQEVNPSPSEENTLRVPQKEWRCRANRIWITLPPDLRDRVNGKSIVVAIDGAIHDTALHPTGQISIPISDNKDSHTQQLVYMKLKCIFDIDEDSRSVSLTFREEKMW